MLLKSESRIYLLFFLLTALSLIFFIIDLNVGSVQYSVFEFINILIGKSTDKFQEIIIFEFRFPRVITAILVGISLSLSGLQMQTLFRNPLAGPYVLGISSGASLGVALLVMGFSGVSTSILFFSINSWAIVISAWLGSALVILLIMAVSVRVKDVMTILILGIMFASATGALVNILQYFSNESLLKTFIIWTMGSLSGVTTSQLYILLPCIFIGVLLSFFSIKALNALLLGENSAKSLGLNIKFWRFVVFLSTSLLAGSITAFCGPIGFVGVAVPHIARYIFKTADHRILMWACVLCGMLIMLISDVISQMPGSAASLPINSVTALLGIPVVVWVIIRNKKIA